MERKYGRLFTEDDVLRIFNAAAVCRCHPSEAITKLDAGDIRRLSGDGAVTLTFPADEPLFLLRGKDLAAHGGAWGYAYEASRCGASVEFVTAALAAANDLRDWAEANRARMKVPD